VSEKRRGLGRGLGALIPPSSGATQRPVDVFFPGKDAPASEAEPAEDAAAPGAGTTQAAEDAARHATADDVSRETAGEVSRETSGVELMPVPGAHFAEISVEQIRPNPKQPRTVFDEDDMA